MRYSIDVAGVTSVASAVAAECEAVPGLVAQSLTAVDDAASAFRAGGADVASALQTVFAARRQSGPGIGVRTVQLLASLQQATTAYVIADETMTATMTGVGAGQSAEPFAGGRGFGPRPVL